MRRAPRAGARLTHCVQVSSEELLDQVLALADGRAADHAGEDAGHGAPLLGDHARRGDAGGRVGVRGRLASQARDGLEDVYKRQTKGIADGLAAIAAGDVVRADLGLPAS